MVTIRIATAADLGAVRALFLEYARTLDFDLCFQGFDAELAALPGDYAPPGGTILVACAPDPEGVVALRPDDHDPSGASCEMKRLYLRPAHRRGGTGRSLATAVIAAARAAGYTRMRLDTVPSMTPAIALYESLGFRRTAPYRHNPIEGAVFLELVL